MPTTIIMPQLGESVAEGIIGKWLKSEGDQVGKDEPIVEIITDKVNAEIPSPVSGVLRRITQPEGATVAVGQEIALIDDTDAGGSREATGANGEREESAVPVAVGTTDGSVSAPRVSAAVSSNRSERVRSSPLVRRLAEQYGINLTEVPGTGLGGRVSKGDILAFIEQKQGAPAVTATATEARPHFTASDLFEREERAPGTTQAPPSFRPPFAEERPPAPAQPAATREPGPHEELVPVSPLRKIIAERMARSMFTIPHAVTRAEVDMSSVVRYREARKDEFRRREDVPLSYVAFVVKATVEALKEYPMVNAEWAGDSIILKKDININVAVDAPEGLTTPIIHHADERSLAGLSKAIHDLAIRARDRKLTIEDMQGGTFTVNNTGALGSVDGVSIINYPQGGILSAAAIVKRPVVVEQDGQDLIAVRSMMNLSFSFDHRLLDGGYAASFVNAVKEKLESWRPDYPIY